ncbi:PREDICTED: uncharacterized protein LOC104783184 [Camelina sativa]|uniref:Uncharacterized protein LOC104783184 n=1 Tax=Camelina sativa TaxID=90675 RepID=A0ABM0YVT9_CAMSA|nr:PREDICTED: uncharacterized protein LOC104783184 [Camelina sativa]
MARHLEDVMSMATTTHFDASYLFHVVFLALIGCCALSAMLFSCADGVSNNKPNSANTTGGGGCGGGGCGGCGGG